MRGTTISEASGSDITLTYDTTAGAQSGFNEFTGILKIGIDEQPIGGDSRTFVASDQADLGIFDGSLDVSNPDDPDQLGAEGAAIYDSQTQKYTVLGSGWDIFDNSDSYHFVYKEVPVDEPILLKATVHTDPFTGNGEWSKAGIMLRNDLDSMEAEAMGAIRADQAFFWQWRTVYGGATN